MLSRMTWSLHAAPPHKQLLLGDVPVVRDESEGLLSNKALWVMPIASDAVIAISRVARGRPKPLTTSNVIALNSRMIAGSSRYVFARDHEPWIDTMVARKRIRRSGPSRK
ncbi:Uncharacterised protein [Xylophilus ampelinus]|nr:Uncharacterised protein [Xylophilus ampelinus]